MSTENNTMRRPRKIVSRTPIPLVMGAEIRKRPFRNESGVTSQNAVNNMAPAQVGNDQRCSAFFSTTKTHMAVNTAATVKLTMIPVSDTFHRVNSKSCYKLIVEVTHGTGTATKLDHETRRAFLNFSKACGLEGFTSTQSVEKEGTTKIVLEQKTKPPSIISALKHDLAIFTTSPRYKETKYCEPENASPEPSPLLPSMKAAVEHLTDTAYIPDGANTICVPRARSCSFPGRAATSAAHSGYSSKVLRRLPSHRIPACVDEEDEQSKWDISPAFTAGTWPNRSRSSTFGSAYSNITSATSLYSPPLPPEGPCVISSSPSLVQSPTIQLTFGEGEAIYMAEDPLAEIPNRTTSLPASPESPGAGPSAGGIMINGVFQPSYGGFRSSRRSGIYFGDNITTLSDVRGSWPTPDLDAHTMTQYARVRNTEEEQEVDEESGVSLNEHHQKMSPPNTDGKNRNTRIRTVGIQQQREAEVAHACNPHFEYEPEAVTPAAGRKRKGRLNHKNLVIRVSKRTGYCHYPLDSVLRSQCATAPPTYSLPSIPSPPQQESVPFPTHSLKAMDFFGTRYQDLSRDQARVQDGPDLEIVPWEGQCISPHTTDSKGSVTKRVLGKVCLKKGLKDLIWKR